MEYTHLGSSGLNVSRLCLGTMNFGPHTSEADSFAIMDETLELGINFFDTAGPAPAAHLPKPMPGDTSRLGRPELSRQFV